MTMASRAVTGGIVLGLAALVAGGCATPAPGPVRVVAMTGQQGEAREGFPPTGAVWRLDEQEFRALGPILPTPDPPPTPRPDERARDETPRLLAPSFIYFGSRYGVGVGDPFFWPRYRHFPYSRPYGYPWAHPWW